MMKWFRITIFLAQLFLYPDVVIASQHKEPSQEIQQLRKGMREAEACKTISQYKTYFKQLDIQKLIETVVNFCLSSGTLSVEEIKKLAADSSLGDIFTPQNQLISLLIFEKRADLKYFVSDLEKDIIKKKKEIIGNENQELQKRIEALNKELEEDKKTLKQREDLIKKKEEEIVEKSKELKEKDEKIGRKKTKAALRNDDIKKKQEEIDAKELAIKKIKEDSEREKRKSEKDKEDLTQQQQQAVDKLNQDIKKLEEAKTKELGEALEKYQVALEVKDNALKEQEKKSTQEQERLANEKSELEKKLQDLEVTSQSKNAEYTAQVTQLQQDLDTAKEAKASGDKDADEKLKTAQANLNAAEQKALAQQQVLDNEKLALKEKTKQSAVLGLQNIVRISKLAKEKEANEELRKEIQTQIRAAETANTVANKLAGDIAREKEAWDNQKAILNNEKIQIKKDFDTLTESSAQTLIVLEERIRLAEKDKIEGVQGADQKFQQAQQNLDKAKDQLVQKERELERKLIEKDIALTNIQNTKDAVEADLAKANGVVTQQADQLVALVESNASKDGLNTITNTQLQADNAAKDREIEENLRKIAIITKESEKIKAESERITEESNKVKDQSEKDKTTLTQQQQLKVDQLNQDIEQLKQTQAQELATAADEYQKKLEEERQKLQEQVDTSKEEQEKLTAEKSGLDQKVEELRKLSEKNTDQYTLELNQLRQNLETAEQEKDDGKNDANAKLKIAQTNLNAAEQKNLEQQGILDNQTQVLTEQTEKNNVLMQENTAHATKLGEQQKTNEALQQDIAAKEQDAQKSADTILNLTDQLTQKEKDWDLERVNLEIEKTQIKERLATFARSSEKKSAALKKKVGIAERGKKNGIRGADKKLVKAREELDAAKGEFEEEKKVLQQQLREKETARQLIETAKSEAETTLRLAQEENDKKARELTALLEKNESEKELKNDSDTTANAELQNTNAELQNANTELQKQIAKKEKEIAEDKDKILKNEATIKTKDEEIAEINTKKENLNKEKQDLDTQLVTWQNPVQALPLLWTTIDSKENSKLNYLTNPEKKEEASYISQITSWGKSFLLTPEPKKVIPNDSYRFEVGKKKNILMIPEATFDDRINQFTKDIDELKKPKGAAEVLSKEQSTTIFSSIFLGGKKDMTGIQVALGNSTYDFVAHDLLVALEKNAKEKVAELEGHLELANSSRGDQVQTLQDTIKEKQKAIEENTSKIKEIETESQEIKEQSDRNKSAVEEKEQVANKLKEELEALKKTQADELVEASRKHEEALKQKDKEFEDKERELKTEEARLKQENTILTTNVNYLRLASKESKDKHTKEIDDLKQKLDDAQAKVTSGETSASEEVLKVREALEEAKATGVEQERNLQEKARLLEEQIKRNIGHGVQNIFRKNQLEKAKEENKTKEEENKKLQQQIETQKEAVETANTKVKALVKKEEAWDQEKLRLEGEKTESEEKLDSFKMESKSKIQGLEAKVEAAELAKSQGTATAQQVEEVKAELDTVKGEIYQKELKHKQELGEQTEALREANAAKNQVENNLDKANKLADQQVGELEQLKKSIDLKKDAETQNLEADIKAKEDEIKKIKDEKEKIAEESQKNKSVVAEKELAAKNLREDLEALKKKQADVLAEAKTKYEKGLEQKKQELEKEKNNLQEKERSFTKEKEQLAQAKSELNEQLKQLKTTSETAATKYEKDISGLQTKLNNIESEKTIGNISIEQANKEKEKVQEELGGLKKQAIEDKEALDSQKQALEEKTKQNAARAIQNVVRKNWLEKEKKANKTKEEENKKLQQEIETQKEAAERAKTNVQELANEFAQKQVGWNQKEETLKKAESNIQEQYSELQRNSAAYLKELLANVATTEEDKKKGEATVDDVKKAQQALVDAKTKIESEKQRLEEKFNKQVAALKDIEDAKSNIEKELEKANALVVEKDLKLAALINTEKTNKQLQEEITAKEEEINQIKLENEEIKKKEDAAKNALATQQQAVKDLTQRTKELEKEKTAALAAAKTEYEKGLEQKKEELEQQEEKFEAKRKELAKENTILTTNVNNLETKLSKKKYKYKEKFNDLTQKLSEATEAVVNKEDGANEALTKVQGELGGLKKQAIEDKGVLEKEKENLEKQVTKNARLMQENEAQADLLAKEKGANEELKQEITKQTAAAKESEAKAAALERQIAQEKEAWNQKETDLNSAKNGIQEQYSELQKNSAAYLKELLANVATTEEDKKKGEATVDDVKKAQQALVDAKKQIESEKLALEENFNKQVKALKEIGDAKSNIEKELEKANALATQQEQKLAVLIETDKTNTALKEQIEANKLSIEQKDRDINAKNDEIKKIKDESATLTEKQQKEVENLKLEIEKLEKGKKEESDKCETEEKVKNDWAIKQNELKKIHESAINKLTNEKKLVDDQVAATKLSLDTCKNGLINYGNITQDNVPKVIEKLKGLDIPGLSIFQNNKELNTGYTTTQAYIDLKEKLRASMDTVDITSTPEKTRSAIAQLTKIIKEKKDQSIKTSLPSLTRAIFEQESDWSSLLLENPNSEKIESLIIYLDEKINNSSSLNKNKEGVGLKIDSEIVSSLIRIITKNIEDTAEPQPRGEGDKHITNGGGKDQLVFFKNFTRLGEWSKAQISAAIPTKIQGWKTNPYDAVETIWGQSTAGIEHYLFDKTEPQEKNSANYALLTKGKEKLWMILNSSGIEWTKSIADNNRAMVQQLEEAKKPENAMEILSKVEGSLENIWGVDLKGIFLKNKENPNQITHMFADMSSLMGWATTWHQSQVNSAVNNTILNNPVDTLDFIIKNNQNKYYFTGDGPVEDGDFHYIPKEEKGYRILTEKGIIKIEELYQNLNTLQNQLNQSENNLQQWKDMVKDPNNILEVLKQYGPAEKDQIKFIERSLFEFKYFVIPVDGTDSNLINDGSWYITQGLALNDLYNKMFVFIQNDVEEKVTEINTKDFNTEKAALQEEIDSIYQKLGLSNTAKTNAQGQAQGAEEQAKILAEQLKDRTDLINTLFVNNDGANSDTILSEIQNFLNVAQYGDRIGFIHPKNSVKNDDGLFERASEVGAGNNLYHLDSHLWNEANAKKLLKTYNNLKPYLTINLIQSQQVKAIIKKCFEEILASIKKNVEDQRQGLEEFNNANWNNLKNSHDYHFNLPKILGNEEISSLFSVDQKSDPFICLIRDKKFLENMFNFVEKTVQEGGMQDTHYNLKNNFYKTLFMYQDATSGTLSLAENKGQEKAENKGQEKGIFGIIELKSVEKGEKYGNEGDGANQLKDYIEKFTLPEKTRDKIRILASGLEQFDLVDPKYISQTVVEINERFTLYTFITTLDHFRQEDIPQGLEQYIQFIKDEPIFPVFKTEEEIITKLEQIESYLGFAFGLKFEGKLRGSYFGLCIEGSILAKGLSGMNLYFTTKTWENNKNDYQKLNDLITEYWKILGEVRVKRLEG